MTVAVLTQDRNTRRQIARALGSGGLSAAFPEGADSFAALIQTAPPDLVILDLDSMPVEEATTIIKLDRAISSNRPVILLSMSEDKAQLLKLVRDQEVSNLVAKHGAIRATYRVLDERELLVTCQKMLRRDIFGIEKYVGLWGAQLSQVRLTGLLDKAPFLRELEAYLHRLDCPARVAPGITTVAEEFILNAMVHAPHDGQGQAKYESIGPRADLTLTPSEYVDVAYGCDGQRLMLSVTDNFGRLSRGTVLNYLMRGIGERRTVETKAGGAGLGLSMAFEGLHQLIFNIQDQVRTEAIAGWYLRVSDAREFKQIAKSLNLFWLPNDARPVARVELPSRPVTPSAAVAQPSRPQGRVLNLTGRIDETTDLSWATRASVLQLREVESFTSQGVLTWLNMVKGLEGHRLQLAGCPESLVRLAGEVGGMLDGLEVTSLMCPHNCPRCGKQELLELPTPEVLSEIQQECTLCGAALQFEGTVHHYRAFLDALAESGRRPQHD